MQDILKIIGRKHELFAQDIYDRELDLKREISGSSFLVLGASGSIGQAVSKEIFKRNPAKLHLVDINENNLAELVRDIRSSYGYNNGEFRTFVLDIGSNEFDVMLENSGGYDYVLNLSALKHVRSEKDPFTLMRMINVNIFYTDKTIEQAVAKGCKKYFCVSTDKAANPVNMMGASKRIMEMFLMRRSESSLISTARFANVAFSEGSLLQSFSLRLAKNQPLVGPSDIRRYFVTPQESGELCLMSCIFGENRDIFFPKLREDVHLITFGEIAERFLAMHGYKAYQCSSESEARALASTLPQTGQWPVFFSPSDTTGEKSFEEFFTDKETLDMESFANIGVIKSAPIYDSGLLTVFEDEIAAMVARRNWSKEELVDLFNRMLPQFKHKETGRYLDGKM
ncbi:UDP-N-acetylglucosamine 4,6-dehydratase [uncultured Sulfitobacter sp.]|uniref:UDP-N-acetylglucosamine 4,6-dehydratase n=1 Tax=uncultured Sulfitobacter sp. TaxID=191468 RepID=UPI0030D8A947|tara:strand:+ start:51747 stop:52937 length:1191 start_codon:yes stop_codon:yes gene_type:complete